MSLEQKYKKIISSGKTEQMKEWVCQSNLGNEKYTKETDTQTIEKGFPTFDYGSLTGYAIYTAVCQNNYEMLDFLFNSPDYLHKLDKKRHAYSESPLNNRENMTPNLFKFIVKNGYGKYLGTSLFGQYDWGYGDQLEVVQDLTYDFCEKNEQLNFLRWIENWITEFSDEKKFRQNILKIAYEIVEKYEFQDALKDNLENNNPQNKKSKI